MESNDLLIDNYYGLLSGLSRGNKMTLIAKLANSMVEETSQNEIAVDTFYGAFKSEKNADELNIELRESRTFCHVTETF